MTGLMSDIMICATSEEEDVAYIETKNLDGETNLKSRNAVTGMTDLRTAAICSTTPVRIDLEAPEVNMFKLNGAAIKLKEIGSSETKIHPVTLETTLLRGCVLRNTAWVIGIVMFTGSDTKIVQNSGGTPSKRSKVERQMNPQVLFNLTLLAVIAVVCALVDHYNELRWHEQQAYWELYADTSGDNPNINGLVTFANAFITFQNIVPISLYISIEFVRTAQALFIYWDHATKYVKNGITTRTKARSWNLSDDLGQIEYIFSDKTGTLTQNAMIFRQCSVGGKIYIGDETPPEDTVPSPTAGKTSSSDSSADSQSQSEGPSDQTKAGGVKVALPKEVLLPFHDANINRDLADHDSEQSRILHGFFSVLGLCHTVLAAEPEPGVIEYKAQSPDEAALVQSAADVGFVFRGRDHNILKMSTPFTEEPDEYELLHVLEFNSTRKRMSVIIRKLDDDGRIFLLCKGADNVIFERLDKNSGQEELKQKTDSDLQHFASEGLRTLCLAYKVIDSIDYEKWAKKYHDASVALQGREEKMEEVSESIETELILLGATAIEDKLQDGVPETIRDLKRAGIKVWVATGDKLETAVAIGYTTNLLTSDTNLIIIREGQYSVADQIREALETFFDQEPLSRQASRTSLRRPRPARLNTGVTSLVGRDNGTRPGGYSLVIEGHALTHAFNDEETEDLLLDLSTRCNTVICCRVSPLQKAQIVHLIKDNLGVMCLAIGDGANDVSMIQAADVGVGISGEEGLQAVNSSDYAIAQFRYLKRLLFFHGHWSYYRNSSMILNFFYKNIIGIGVLFWYMIYCGWSTTYVLSYTYLLFWNVFWTLTPVLAIGLFDRNSDADILMAVPELYAYGRKGSYFGLKIFLYYMLEGVFESAVVFFFIIYTYDTTTTRTDGYDVYIYEMSTTMAIAAVMVANAFHAINIRAWTGWTYFAIALGPFLVWVYTAIFSIIPPSSFATGVYGNDVFLFRSAAYWFGWIYVFVIALLPRYLFLHIKLIYFPDKIDELRLVRKYHPEIDFATHPMFNPDTPANGENGTEGEIPMDNLKKVKSKASAKSSRSVQARPSIGAPRASMSSARFGANASARGSQLDSKSNFSDQGGSD
jgi:phospholipid-translocating ATPase